MGGFGYCLRVIVNAAVFCAWLLLGQFCLEADPAKAENVSVGHDVPGHPHDGHAALPIECSSAPSWIVDRHFVNSRTPNVMSSYPISVLQVLPSSNCAAPVSLSSLVSTCSAPALFMLHSAFLI